MRDPTGDRPERDFTAATGSAFITALAPTLGYDNAVRIFQRSLQEEKSIRQVLAEERLLSTEQLDAILDLPALAIERG